jgi:xylan 1,4-beta-xylosidase
MAVARSGRPRRDRALERNGGRDWPDEAGWARLRAADRLEDLHPATAVEAVRGAIRLDFELPMPAVSLLELTPKG